MNIASRHGRAGRQSSPLVLNLDHLEDGSIEVLLHELLEQKTVAAGEEPPETYAAAAAALAARGTSETADGNRAGAPRSRSRGLV